ncbi:MAG: tRNA 2-thiouridine(34) synthase MnmA [Candidatus Omnitrophica bacterium]|nr:tRNA 2-thiouridine(34) synthase MnmA [Candidatus Omnitrophota bacterium]MDD5042257.1 tRNA 2-thiouridine(34) synthase MnmA [Candidatus Omnitrophota bacterium]MDD5500112.1 tRNA 2-thiouridine(34) synthase MnmA [Candidatus Omnitrophota bacterium]
MSKKVFVAMSGGVDSSVAAALLLKEGHEVVGLTMCFNLAEKEGGKPSCCGLSGLEDARRVAHKLGIPHYVINLDREFSRKVVDNFFKEYILGRTPNPCVRCNQFIKFDSLLRRAFCLGGDFLATGHYARIIKTPQGLILGKGRDHLKDQSYFLYRLRQWQLKKIIFPLGIYNKQQVRKMAVDLGLGVADKQDSQEVCFLPPEGYAGLVNGRYPGRVNPGHLVDKDGNVLGEHRGVAFYTIGQRQGLGVARGYPLYVTRIDPKRNIVVAGPRREALKKEFTVKDPCFPGQPFKKKVEIGVKIRYNHKESLAEAYPVKSKLKIRFKNPQFAVTPGQSAVFYRGDKVLGGGIIEKVLG